MTDTSSKHSKASPDNGEQRHVLAWLLFPLALFPLVALLTYDWHAIPTLQCPPYPSTNWIGALGDGFAYYGYTLFGLAIWIVPILCVIAGLSIVAGRKMTPGRRELWFFVFLASNSCLVQALGQHGSAFAFFTQRLNLSDAGGVIGYLLMTRCLSPLLSNFGSSVVIVIVMVFSIIAAVGLHNLAAFFVAIYRWATVGAYMKRVTDENPANGTSNAPADPAEAAYLAALKAKEEARRQREEEKAAAKAQKEAEKEAKRQAKEEARLAREAERHPQPPVPQQGLFSSSAAPVAAPAKSATAPATTDNGASPAEEEWPYILPPLSLLNPLQKAEADHSDVGEMSKRLIDTLKLFNIEATLAYTVQGPVVTKYALSLAPGTRYSTVTNIEANLKGAMYAKSLRIEAPILGEDHVGIEVPNKSAAGISFREIIESDAWKKNALPIGNKPAKYQLPLLFGKDAAGHDLVADLATMPHMLVAGATGQGKSVCLNAIINGLLMTRTPEQLKLIMVDPKSVEFTSYAAIPHLIVPVITDNKKVVFSLHWAVAEMEKRLKLFARARCRNITDFNTRKSFTQTDMFGHDTEVDGDMPKTLPYIVIIIDEVADLMSTSAKDVVPDISRLAAKARAAGIHLILATQRPDAKVITGTIKANIPGRVAFKTATAIDSRTILDDGGAENLIGRGDMLFKSKDGQLIRAQGAWISDPEIERITSFLQEHTVQHLDERFTKKLNSIKEDEIDPYAEDDAATDAAEGKAEAEAAKAQIKADENANDFKKAVQCIIETQRASTSHFQRRLGWGYNHSAKIMDQLQDAGIIGPQSGAGPRPIIMDQDQLIAILNNGTEAVADNAAQIGEEAADDVSLSVDETEPTREMEAQL